MARTRRNRARLTSKAVTPERAARLYRLLRLLAEGPQSRSKLGRGLRLDIRGFYRDLELLRAAGIELQLSEGRYQLRKSVASAVAHLPFPDPHLNLGEALQLAKGRTRVHRKLRTQIALIIGRKR